MIYAQTLAALSGAAIAAAGLIVWASPEAKEWLARVIRRTAALAVSELEARAVAQRAATAAWERAYRSAIDEAAVLDSRAAAAIGEGN